MFKSLSWEELSPEEQSMLDESRELMERVRQSVHERFTMVTVMGMTAPWVDDRGYVVPTSSLFSVYSNLEEHNKNNEDETPGEVPVYEEAASADQIVMPEQDDD